MVHIRVDNQEEAEFIEALYKAVQNTKYLAGQVGDRVTSFKAIKSAMNQVAQREEMAAEVTEVLLKAAYQRGFAHGQANPPIAS